MAGWIDGWIGGQMDTVTYMCGWSPLCRWFSNT